MVHTPYGSDEEEEFADVLAWLCTLANINEIDLEKACEKYSRGDVEGFKQKVCCPCGFEDTVRTVL